MHREASTAAQYIVPIERQPSGPILRAMTECPATREGAENTSVAWT